MSESFSGTTGGGVPQLPDEITFTVDGTTPYKVTEVFIPNGATKVSIYFVTNAGIVSVAQTVSDADTLTATSSWPVPADTWFDLDVGRGAVKADASRIPSFFIGSATVATRVHVIAMGAAEVF